jgi:hypothetical protein
MEENKKQKEEEIFFYCETELKQDEDEKQWITCRTISYGTDKESKTLLVQKELPRNEWIKFENEAIETQIKTQFPHYKEIKLRGENHIITTFVSTPDGQYHLDHLLRDTKAQVALLDIKKYNTFRKQYNSKRLLKCMLIELFSFENEETKDTLLNCVLDEEGLKKIDRCIATDPNYNQILVVFKMLENKQFSVTLPTGSRRLGEYPFECAVRILSEEFGLSLFNYPFSFPSYSEISATAPSGLWDDNEYSSSRFYPFLLKSYY